MSVVECTRRIQFSSGHRVLNHEGGCSNLHGHNYIVYITAKANSLDWVGRVIDFSVLKEKVGGWIMDHWDHTFILYDKDEEVIELLKNFKWNKRPSFMADNPTAENMALHLLNVVCPIVLGDTAVQATKIVVWETENCHAEARLD